MRTLLLIVAAVVIAATGFTAYIWWQDPGRIATNVQTPLGPTSRQEGVGGVGAISGGKNIVVKTLGKDGQITSIFRAQEYVPTETRGVADVIKPEYEFFLKNGRRLTLVGDKGTVNLEERKGRNNSNSNALGSSNQGTAAPTNGQLYGVVIRLFEQDMTRPSMTLSTNNVSFDNQTLKIATERYTDANGKEILADQVPVTIRGDDVDFDGRGLTVRYDDLNEQIALLQIAHGERIVLKNPHMIAGSRKATEKAKPTAPPSAGPVALPTEVAAPAPVIPAAPTTVTTTATTKPAPSPYRATFRDQVRITQGDAPMAEADVITIDFRPGDDDDKKKPAATQPTTKPTTRIALATTTSATTQATTEPVEVAAATTAPATKPADQPIVLQWHGPLVLTAIKDKDLASPLAAGDAAVKATGSPLVLHQPQGTVVCSSMVFKTADNSVSFYSGDAAGRVTFSDAKNDTSLVSHQVDYNDTTKIAVLTGASNLHMKLPRPTTLPTTQPAPELAASWTDRCELQLAEDDSGAAKRVDLRGAVDIQHPQMKLKSDALSLGFEPDTKDKGKSNLSSAVASGNVNADLSDAEHPNRRVKSDKLSIKMDSKPDGTLYAHLVDAEGSVIATDTDQSLAANHVRLAMKPKPTTQPASTQPVDQMASVELESFLAEGNVALKGKESYGLADEIAAAMVDGKQVIRLTGKPATLAQQGRTITGPSIVARPDDGYALVDGAGKLSAEGSATTRPADMTWAGRAELDAGKNLITFSKDIKIKTSEQDGTVINATADECVVTLKAGPPTTKPTTVPAKAQSPAAEALKNKVIASVTLNGHVIVDSDLTTDGKLIKRTNLRADKVVAGLDDLQQLSTVDIPGPGQALHEDRRDQKPGQDKSAGAIAIEWKKGFHLDQKPEPLATITGNVKIVQLPTPDSPASDMMTLEASRVRIAFEPQPTTRPTTRLAATPATTRSTTRQSIAVGVKHIDAAAPVVFTKDKTKIFAQSLQFTPSEHMVVLIGNDRTPVEWWDGDTSKGTFNELWYDTQEQTVRVDRIRMRARP